MNNEVTSIITRLTAEAKLLKQQHTAELKNHETSISMILDDAICNVFGDYDIEFNAAPDTLIADINQHDSIGIKEAKASLLDKGWTNHDADSSSILTQYIEVKVLDNL